MPHELKDDEVIVGSKIEGKIGGYITFFGKPYRIAMRLDRTGMGFDTSVFLNLKTARNMIRKLETVPLFDVGNLDQVVSSVMVKAKTGQDTRALANTILQRHAIDFNLDMVMSKTMMSDIASRLQLFARVMYGLGALLWLLATGVLMLVFSIVLNERKREFSLLRLLGASKKKLSAILFTESFLISLTGAVCGLFLSALMVFFLPYTDQLLYRSAFSFAGTAEDHTAFPAESGCFSGHWATRLPLFRLAAGTV